MRRFNDFWWADDDEKLLLVFDDVQDLSRMLAWCENTRTAIQAGGAMGVWPLALAEEFEQVVTFEPQPDNFDCLERNVMESDLGSRVQAFRGALGAKLGYCSLGRAPSETHNSGAWFATTGMNVPVFAIDDLFIEPVDFLQLDVEGQELAALKGAEQTIARDRPVVVLEEKLLPHMSKDPARARRWLVNKYGYRVVDEIKRDIVLAP